MKTNDRLALIKNRYMQDGLATRLGGLAANLARISSFSDDIRHLQAVDDLLIESEHFIECTAKDAELKDQERLVELQLELAGWQFRLREVWDDESKRREIADVAKNWSNEVLEMSGLLKTSGSR